MKVPQLITESYLSKWKTNSFLSAMLWAAMGLVLIVIRDQVHYSTCYLLGLILLIQGIPHLFLFIIEEEKHIFSISSLIILFLPLEETGIVSIWSGSLLILDGISDFWMWSVLTTKSNEHRGI